MGWLGYTEQETLDSTIPGLLLARKGRIDYLIFTGVLKKKEGDNEIEMGPVDDENEFDRRTRALG